MWISQHPFMLNLKATIPCFFSHCSTGRLGQLGGVTGLGICKTRKLFCCNVLLLLEVLAPTGLETGFICHLFIFLLTSEYKFVVSFVSGTHGFTLAQAGGSGRKIHFPYQFYLLSQLSIELFHFVNK